jgi:hypothetical protein
LLLFGIATIVAVLSLKDAGVPFLFDRVKKLASEHSAMAKRFRRPFVAYGIIIVSTDSSIPSGPLRLQALMSPLLIRPHQARVPRHVGGEDRGEAADRGTYSRAATDPL